MFEILKIKIKENKNAIGMILFAPLLGLLSHYVATQQIMPMPEYEAYLMKLISYVVSPILVVMGLALLDLKKVEKIISAGDS